MTNSELVIIHQNINQKFTNKKDIRNITEGDKTPESIVKNVLNVTKDIKADVIVFTEFRVLDNYCKAIQEPLIDAGYEIFRNTNLLNPKNKNVKRIAQVLIAIKSDIIAKQDAEICCLELDQNDAIYSKASRLTYDNIGITPNYLRVDLKLNGKPYSIIGTRIRLLNSGGEEERAFRAKQLKVLLNSIPKDRELIIVGDFNISPSDCFRKKDSKWHFDEIYLKSLDESDLICKWPVDGNSPCGSEHKLDHIIFSNKLKVNEVEYIGGKYCQTTNTINLPDHPILYAKIKTV